MGLAIAMVLHLTVITEEEIDKRDGVGKAELPGDGVYSENHRLTCSVERRQVVHLGVVTLDGRVAEDEG